MTEPMNWQVTSQTRGAVDSVLLGDTPEDDYRIGLQITGPGEDGDPLQVDPQIVYPCRACGWELACADGEDCHS